MKEKIKRITLKIIFLVSLFLTVAFLVRIITPSYCIIHKVGLLMSESCNWQYSIEQKYRITFTIAIFILTLFAINFFKKTKRNEK